MRDGAQAHEGVHGLKDGNDHRPIGVFDSGVGGLSILRAIRNRLPNETLLYVADSAHVPYGDRSAAFIAERSMYIAEFLARADAKAIVVACNTATVVAVEVLRARSPVPIVALEPAIKPAVALTRTGVIAVLATSRTLQSSSVARLWNRYSEGARILLQACPGLVEQVERGELTSAATMNLLQSYIHPLVQAGADIIVLGCTHYVFLEAQIRAVAGAAVSVLDSSAAVARQVERRIGADASAATASAGPREIFFSSAPDEQVRAVISRLWGGTVDVRLLPDHVSSSSYGCSNMSD